MNQHPDRSSDKDSANSSTEVLALGAEVAALRKRLAALEPSAPGHNAKQSIWKINSRTIITVLVLVTMAVVWMVLEKPFVVHSQSGVTDPLTIDKNGNVGIRTTTPSATLDVNGDLKARTASIDGNVNAASLRFPDGTTQASAAPPAGAVIAFDLSACPAGWTEYAQARGRFIRGIDKSGAGIDPDGQRSVGSTQEDAIRNITGAINGVNGGSGQANPWGFGPGTNGAFDVPNNTNAYNRYGGGYDPRGGVGWSANFDASRVVPTAAENRPKNVALLYCRKN